MLPALGEHYTCHAVDRRGRGGSADNPTYALEREFEDVAAVCRSIAGPVHLLGHSYGGLCALGAAPLIPNLRRLVLYEIAAFPEHGGTPFFPADAPDQIETRVQAGDREGALVYMMQHVAGVPERDLAVMRTLPAWQARIAAVHTAPRELRNDQDWRPDPEQLARVRAPTLLLLGERSPPLYRAAAETLAAMVPDLRTQVLPGQTHVAMDTAPDLFVAAVHAFLAR